MDQDPSRDKDNENKDDTTKRKPSTAASNAGEGASSSNQDVVIRRRSELTPDSAVDVEQVDADVGPIFQAYFIERSIERANRDPNQEEQIVHKVLEQALVREPGLDDEIEDDEDEDEDDGVDRRAGASRQGSFSNSPPPNSREITHRIAREIAALGDNFQRLHMPFEKTYKLMEERADLDGGGTKALFTVFRDAVRRLLTTQSISWSTLVTLFEFAYYVMRRFALKVIQKFRDSLDKAVQRIRKLASAIVRYVRDTEVGIVNWLADQGGWGAALDLEAVPTAYANQQPAPVPSNEGASQANPIPNTSTNSNSNPNTDPNSVAQTTTSPHTDEDANAAASMNAGRVLATLSPFLVFSAALMMAWYGGFQR